MFAFRKKNLSSNWQRQFDVWPWTAEGHLWLIQHQKDNLQYIWHAQGVKVTLNQQASAKKILCIYKAKNVNKTSEKCKITMGHKRNSPPEWQKIPKGEIEYVVVCLFKGVVPSLLKVQKHLIKKLRKKYWMLCNTVSYCPWDGWNTYFKNCHCQFSKSNRFALNVKYGLIKNGHL